MNYPALSNLNSKSIIPPMGTGRPHDIGPVAVMVSAEPDLRYIKQKFKKGKSFSFFMSTLFTPENSEKGIFDAGISCSYTGPYMGAPYGAALLESLIAKGAESIIVSGWCGAVSPYLHTGDILIPNAAISDEGTSRNYIKTDDHFPLISSDLKLRNILIEEMIKRDMQYKEGNIWTTDAIYRETPEKVAFFKKKGAVAVEMECSALFSVAKFRKKDIAAVLVVSDEVKNSGWKPGFRDKRFREARKKVSSMICEMGKNDFNLSSCS